MATGTVKWFGDEKGFGFITPDEAGKDLLSLAEGASLSYDGEAGDKGPKASNLRGV